MRIEHKAFPTRLPADLKPYEWYESKCKRKYGPQWRFDPISNRCFRVNKGPVTRIMAEPKEPEKIRIKVV